ncbi:MAG: polyprenyl synthetase family protein, partial [Bacteroidota bacterium]
MMNLEKAGKHIDKELNEYNLGDNPQELYNPVRYALTLESQRLRPLLSLWGCHLFSDDAYKALRPGIGVEIFHYFMLLHGDIIHDIGERGGKDTVHRKWNDNVAILAGDVMVFKAYDLMLEADESVS